MSWYKQSFAESDKTIAEQEARREERFSGPRRFWLRAGETRTIILLEDEPFCIYEHQVEVDGDQFATFTCLRGIADQCPFCDGGSKAYWVGLFTCIDMTPYQTREGQTVPCERKILPLKSDSLKKFSRRKAENGQIKGGVFTLFRTAAKKERTGDDITFKGFVQDWNTVLLPDRSQLAPFNFLELVAPKPLEEAQNTRFFVRQFGKRSDPQGTFNQGQTGTPWSAQAPSLAPAQPPAAPQAAPAQPAVPAAPVAPAVATVPAAPTATVPTAPVAAPPATAVPVTPEAPGSPPAAPGSGQKIDVPWE